MEKKIKIYISCHKESYVPNNSLLYPIQVGAAISNKRFEGMLHDDIGDNISVKNPMYCELTAQYWAWKNDDADYYGFFHYRRYMSFAEKELPHDNFENVLYPSINDHVLKEMNFNENSMIEKITKYDVIATTEVDLKKLNPILKSNYYQYEITPYQYKEDLDVMLEIIKEKYPEYYDTAKKYLFSDHGYYCNMFIMKKEIFLKYSEWLFTILSEHEKRRDYSNYSIEAYRVSGYLGERLFGIYYEFLKKDSTLKLLELQRTLFNNVDKKNNYYPYFKEQNVALCLAANDYFLPYTACLIKSIVDNSNPNKNYDIIILTQDASDKTKSLLKDIISNCKNFFIRYADPTEFIEGYSFFIRGHFGLQTYYRLVLPDLLPNYDKVLYLDSDMIVNADISELYDINVDGFLIGASYDADTAGLYNGYQWDKKEYTDKIMKLKDPYSYFQAGTLLINLKEFRKIYSTEEILKFATSYKWQLLDQDILNCLCEGRVKYIDMSWNVMIDFEGKRIRDIIRLAPQWLNKMFMEARKHPKIIHYAGPEKPWLNPEMDMAMYFWKYARKIQFYEILLYRMSYYVAHINTYNLEQTIRLAAKDSRQPFSLKEKIKNKLLPINTKRGRLVRRIYHHFK